MKYMYNLPGSTDSPIPGEIRTHLVGPREQESIIRILSFRTDMPGQTVQTQIRVYTVCHSVCIVWTHFSMVELHSSNFRVITNFLGVRIFRKFTVLILLDYRYYWNDLKILDRQGWCRPDHTALKDQSDQGLHCLPFRLHLLGALLYGKNDLSKF